MGSEPNPAGGGLDRLGQVIGLPQDTHKDAHFHTHSVSFIHTLIKTFKHLKISNVLIKMGI